MRTKSSTLIALSFGRQIDVILQLYFANPQIVETVTPQLVSLAGEPVLANIRCR